MMHDTTPQIVSVTLLNGGDTLQVIKRHPSNMVLACNPPLQVPDRLTKDIYCVVDGKIALLKTEEGKAIPQQITPEKFVFDNEE